MTDELGSTEGRRRVREALDGPSVVTFIVPLPHPIGFPDGSTITIHRPERVPWLEGVMRRVAAPDYMDTTVSESNYVSFMFRRINKCPSSTVTMMERAAVHLDTMIDSAGILTSATADQQIEVDGSVLEATTPLITPDSGDFAEALADALDRVFESFSDIVIAYRLQTQDLAVELLSRLNCVPWVPYVIRTGDFVGNDSFRRGMAGLYSVNDGESLREERFREIDDPDVFLCISRLAFRHRLGDPTMGAYHELLRARRACFLYGDFQSAVTSAFSAIEFFFGAVLNLLHWESGTPRTDVQSWFDNEGFATRLKKRYHPLLGGNWNPETPTSIISKINRVSKLRGRVVHAGYAPTEGEAIRAIDSSSDAIDSLKAMLVSKRHKFNRTNLIVLGNAKLVKSVEMTDEMKRRITEEAIQVNQYITSYISWLE